MLEGDTRWAQMVASGYGRQYRGVCAIENAGCLLALISLRLDLNHDAVSGGDRGEF